MCAQDSGVPAGSLQPAASQNPVGHVGTQTEWPLLQAATADAPQSCLASSQASAHGCAWFPAGNDGGGSIRIPAAACGIFGIKPTFGRDNTRGTPQLMWSVTSQGPLAGCVADASIAYAVIANAGEPGALCCLLLTDTVPQESPLHSNQLCWCIQPA